MADNSIDLATAAGIQRYLADTHFASDTVVVLAGGFSNFTYRIHLSDPCDGKETFILKYAPPYFATSGGTIPFATERQKFEVEALRLVLNMHANDDVISVPAVYLFDEKVHVVIIEDCGTDTQTLKQLVIDEALPQIVAEEIGVAIGRFLARIHAWNKETSFDMDIFTNNEAGKKMASFLSYDRLIPTLSGQNNIADLADPVLDISKAKLDVISKLAQTRSHEINNNTAPESFTHSDFWPANIMVSLRRESDGGTPRLNKLHVLDWEMATVGLRGLDIGQFCGEMRLLQRFYPSRQEEASTIMKYFLSAYRGGRGSDETLARVTVSHAGAYLAVWASLEQPGNREETRGAVAEGVDLLIGGAEGTRTWLEGSFVGDLVV